ncbi:MAG: RNA methyltransferase [Devosiaceae bacterium]
MTRFGLDGVPANLSNLGVRPPVVILVEPQMGENIGMVARAMANFGWRNLRLVRPRDGWPNERANATASGGAHIVADAQLFDTLEEALADLTLVFATSARKHDLAKEVVGPQAAAQRSVASEQDARVGYLFGRENWGLTNEEVALCDDILTLPVDEECASLNIAQAAVVCAYEWRKHALAQSGARNETEGLPVQTAERSAPADKGAMQGLFSHLERLLDTAGFFRPPEKRDGMIVNLRTIFQRARLNDQEVRTLRGVFSSLDRVHERVEQKRAAANQKARRVEEDSQ